MANFDYLFHVIFIYIYEAVAEKIAVMCTQRKKWEMKAMMPYGRNATTIFHDSIVQRRQQTLSTNIIQNLSESQNTACFDAKTMSLHALRIHQTLRLVSQQLYDALFDRLLYITNCLTPFIIFAKLFDVAEDLANSLNGTRK